MSALKAYKKKRNLNQSPEPKARLQKSGHELIFVIQKHDASHLHFDLRLELYGVLKSWAVPKGPPLNNEKRLAIMVEDHPYDYKDFEGSIPKGHYGAGDVEIWDSGVYFIKEASNIHEAQKIIEKKLKKGHLTFTLQGKKLQGDYSLIKTALSHTKNSWLWVQRAETMPDFVAPMLAYSIKEPFNNKSWIFEIKWDGYRALAFIKNNKASLMSRNKQLFNTKFSPIIEDLEKYIMHEVILDGEIVILDKDGRPSFQLLQNYSDENMGHLFYYVFDILYLDKRNLQSLELLERKAILEQILAPLQHTHIRFSDHIKSLGKKLFEEALKLNLEGIIAKEASSTYVSARSKKWLKIKTHNRQEAVIAGFSESQTNTRSFGSLLLGVYDGLDFCYIGKVGTGFSAKSIEDLSRILSMIVQQECPFKKRPQSPTKITFVKPLLVCEISFSEWTKDKHMRHPVFMGLRSDKKARDVSFE